MGRTHSTFCLRKFLLCRSPELSLVFKTFLFDLFLFVLLIACCLFLCCLLILCWFLVDCCFVLLIACCFFVVCSFFVNCWLFVAGLLYVVCCWFVLLVCFLIVVVDQWFVDNYLRGLDDIRRWPLPEAQQATEVISGELLLPIGFLQLVSQFLPQMVRLVACGYIVP